MPKKKIKQVNVCLREYKRDIEDIVANMCDKLSDLPDSFRHCIEDGVVYMALFDSGYNDEDFWENVSEYIADAFIAYFESQTDFTDTQPRSRNVRLKPLMSDVLKGTDTDEDLLISDVDENDSERAEYVVGISDEIPRHYHWSTREDMECTAELVADEVTEMFAEYDLASDDDFVDFACVVRDAVLGETGTVSDIDRFTIDLNRRKLSVGVKQGSYFRDIDMSFLNRIGVDDALSIRNGSRSRRAS